MAEAVDPLAELYPYLSGRAGRPTELDPALTESVRQKAADSVAVKERFFAAETAKLIAAAHALASVFRGGGRLFAMGNGGSSCDAAHIAVEFTHPVTVGRPALAAIDLAANTAMLTAVGNDVGFRDIFVRQLIAHAKPGDAVIGVSTSGNSENVDAGFTAAKRLGLLTIALLGGDGGMLARSRAVDHCFTVPSDSIHRIQECHVAIYHILWDLVHTILAESRGAATAAQ